ncbi:MAG TPA: hypothetical protein VFO30_02230 [Chthoniobacterales bacterium]|nr:hypothetical protein [Chthoniobacterales bacterium]
MPELQIANCRLQIVAVWLLVIGAAAQESSTPPISVTPTPPPSSARTVRISFVPPPLEGTISLGIFDRTGKLVRVLHQEAELDEFTVEADGLETKWDGKNDDGKGLPAGKYRARGYTVGCKVEELGTSPNGLPSNTTEHVTVKLVANPLSKGANLVVELAVGFDDENCFLQTTDGLPLLTVSETPNLWRAFVAKSGERSVDVFQDDGDTIDQLRVSNVNQMMAFDCGEIELK